MAKKQKNAVENQTVYQHTRGIVKDNAIMALLHDKLFRQRIEKNVKAKAVTNVKQNTQVKCSKNPMINFLLIETLSSVFSFVKRHTYFKNTCAITQNSLISLPIFCYTNKISIALRLYSIFI